MSESLYLGLVPANDPVMVDNVSAGILTAGMHSASITELSGTHRAPCVTRADVSPAVTYPVLGAAGMSYGGLPYEMRPLDMRAERIPLSDVAERDQPLNITVAVVGGYIGTFIHRYTALEAAPESTPVVTAEAAALAAVSGMGYTTLHVRFGQAVNHKRKVDLLGENSNDGTLHTLPFQSRAADLLIGRLQDALYKDMPFARTPRYR